MKNKYKFTILLGLVMSMFTWGESFAFVPQMSVLSGKTVSVIAEGTRVKEGDVLVLVDSLVGPVPAARATVDGVVIEVTVGNGQIIDQNIKSLLFLNDHKGEIFVMKWDKKCKLTAMICCALSLGVLSTAFAEFMSVSEVKEGMHGIGKTVIHGTTIDTFDVDVLGVMKNRGANGGDLVLVKVSGPVIDSSNGIAHGMSGSPVYINNKLLGAVAYGFSQSGGRIGMVTPIEDMLKIWAIDDNKVQVDTLKPSKDLIPLNTPLMATGYSSSGLEYLTKKMKNFQMVPYAAASSSEDTTAMPLVPGSSVAATMVTGDLKLGAIGTVTYVDDDHILAFGHPFMSKGNTDYFMHNSYIFTVIPSTYSPFKLGSIGAEIGTINQRSWCRYWRD